MWQEYVQWGIVGVASLALYMWFPSFIQNKRGGGSGHPGIKFPAKKKKLTMFKSRLVLGCFPMGVFFVLLGLKAKLEVYERRRQGKWRLGDSMRFLSLQ